MKRLILPRKGLIVSVPVMNATNPTSFIKGIQNTETEVIGKIFRYYKNHEFYLILSKNDRNLTTFNPSKIKLFYNNINGLRLTTDEEKKYWNKNDSFYSFTLNIPYKSKITNVFAFILIKALIIKLENALIDIQNDYQKSSIARNMQIETILESLSILGAQLLEEYKNGLKRYEKLENRYSIVEYIPQLIIAHPAVFKMLYEDIDTIWKYAIHMHRMWLYR